MEDWKIEENENELIVKIPKQKDYTLKQLKQKIINYLYGLESYEDTDVELLKMLFIEK